MELPDLYPAQVGSPYSTLAVAYTSGESTMTLVDATKLPTAPNIVCLAGVVAGEFSYTGKEGNVLQGVTALPGTPAATTWPAGTFAFRGIAAYDLNAIHENMVRTATYVVAASNAPAHIKRQADYVCDGTADDVEIQAAIDALPATGGHVHLTEGTYHLAATVTRAIDAVTVSGSGYSTYLVNNASTPLFSVGTQKNWAFSNMRLDFGGLELETGSGWSIDNVWRDGNGIPGQLIDQWSDEHAAPRSKGNFLTEAHRHPLMAKLLDADGEYWVKSSVTTGTMEYDTTITRGHARSLKITTEPGDHTKIVGTLPSTTDLTDCAFGVWIYTPDYTKIANIRLYRYTGNPYHYCIRKPYYINNGWMFLVFDQVEEHVHLSPNPASSDRIFLEVYAASGQIAEVYVDSVWYWKRGALAPNGIVTMTFDDGYTEVETLAKPEFDKYGYKGVQSVIISRLNEERLQSAKRLQDAGWDIVSHSYDHRSYANACANPKREYLLSQKWLADNGFERGSAFAFLAFGAHDKRLVDIVNNNLTLARAFNLGRGNSIPGIGNLIHTYHVTYESSPAGVKSLIDDAIANHRWINICFHRITETPASGHDWSPSQIGEVLAYCYARGIEVLTYSQVVDRIRATAQNMTLSGSGTIANGTTSVNIRHGFHRTPRSIQITPTSSLGAATSIWISDRDPFGKGNVFTVSVDVDPGQDVTFDWVAML